jgi:hypothetical protein
MYWPLHCPVGQCINWFSAFDVIIRKVYYCSLWTLWSLLSSARLYISTDYECVWTIVYILNQLGNWGGIWNNCNVWYLLCNFYIILTCSNFMIVAFDVVPVDFYSAIVRYILWLIHTLYTVEAHNCILRLLLFHDGCSIGLPKLSLNFGQLYRVSKKTLWKFNRLSCIINVSSDRPHSGDQRDAANDVTLLRK